MALARFVSIPASNYVEKARWALQLARVPFTEIKFAPLLAYASTVPNGGRSVPLLVLPPSAGGDGDTKTPKVLTDSADILDYCATKQPSLYPTSETKALELHYDKKLGPYARCIAYHLLFMDPTAGRQILAGPLGFFQYYVAWLLYPLLKIMLQRGLNVNAKTAEMSWSRVEQIVADAEVKLGDGPVGSRFLDGSSFSAADIAFCAHMSLLLFPPQHIYIGSYISIDRVKDAVFKKRLETLQQSKVGQYVLWCYANHRPAMAPRAKL